MRFPWTNIILFLVATVLAVSGFAGLLSGWEGSAWVLWSHGIAAYTLLVLFGWKGGIILDALRRKKRWTGRRIGFFSLLGLLLVTLLLGLAWTFIGPIYWGGFSLVSLHIYLAVPVLALILWHSWRMKFILRVRNTFSRRLFIDAAVASLAGLALWRGAAWLKSGLGLNGAGRRFTGSYEVGSGLGRFPAVSWINDRPDPIASSSWRLTLGGAVATPQTWALADLEQRPLVEIKETLDCTGGWYTRQVWEGVPLRTLLAVAGPLGSAESVTVRSVTGYRRRFSLAEADRLLLARRVAGRPLTHPHGAPLRLVVPGGRGFEWVKWVTHVEVNTTPAFLQSPLPLQ